MNRKYVMPAELTVLWVTTALSQAASSAALSAERQGLTVTDVAGSKVDVALTIVGRWGTFIIPQICPVASGRPAPGIP